MVTREVVHQCNYTAHKGYLLNLDFEYDIIDYECLSEVLHLRGFGDRWILWIEIWLKSTKAQILINGMIDKGMKCKGS